MRAALHRAATTANPDRGRDLDDRRRRAHRAPPRSGAHASRWCVDELAERAPRPPRLRAERRARHNSFSSRARVGPSELYGYDAHGNTAFLTDGSGTVTDTYTYDAWGNLVGRTGATSNTRLYAGEEFDPDLGFTNLRARYYISSTGRFTSADPLDRLSSLLPRPFPQFEFADVERVFQLSSSRQETGDQSDHFEAARNAYLYGRGDPISFVDRSGRIRSTPQRSRSQKRWSNLLSSRLRLRLERPSSKASRLQPY